MRFVKKLQKRWQQWRFYRCRSDLAELHNVVRAAVAQGNQHPVGRAKRGRYD